MRKTLNRATPMHTMQENLEGDVILSKRVTQQHPGTYLLDLIAPRPAGALPGRPGRPGTGY